MRPHHTLFIPWLATVTQAIDTCGYLVTDPLAANLLHARQACSSFQQSTTSLCAATTTTTRVITATTPVTTVQTLTVTNNATVTTTVVTSVIPPAALTTITTTTQLQAQPTGPIAGSLDRRDAAAIPCPRLYGPEVPGPFAFFCQAPAFQSACNKVGISATIQTLQSKITSTVSRTTTVGSVLTVATAVTTTATVQVTTTVSTRVATPTSTVIATETDVPYLPFFPLNYKGSVNGVVGGTTTVHAGDPITLQGYKTYEEFSFAIGGAQTLLAAGTYPAFVSQANNSNVIDYVVRYSGYVDGRDPNALHCELSAPPKGVLSCISGTTTKTTLFQTCKGDGQLYHGPGLLPGCSALQLSVS